MSEEEKIINVLYRFEESGLLYQDIDMLLDCIAERILGIGLGEQGIVRSKEDVARVLQTGCKDPESPNSHVIRYEKLNVLQHSDTFATVCAEVIVTPKRVQGDHVPESRFFQSLTVTKERGEWRICALHASTPLVTEETLEAYPLKFAEKTLQSLVESIGERFFQAEEQFRQAILADTIAFYIVNFTTGRFEKCQCNGDVCLPAEPGTPYERHILDNIETYVMPEDQERFIRTFRQANIEETLRRGAKELTCEYRLLLRSGGYLWAATTVRLIQDAETGHQKGIMYVRDIDAAKREELALVAKASYDGMTKLYNKESFIQAVDRAAGAGGVLVMLDVDRFKSVNDTFGHPVGDLVLIAVAQLLNQSFTGDGPVGRLGGDEFCVFLPGAGYSPALAERLDGICSQVRQLGWPEAPQLSVTCSIGAAACGPDSSFNAVYRLADNALYRSKANGRNRATFFEKTR